MATLLSTSRNQGVFIYDADTGTVYCGYFVVQGNATAHAQLANSITRLGRNLFAGGYTFNGSVPSITYESGTLNTPCFVSSLLSGDDRTNSTHSITIFNKICARNCTFVN